MAIWKSIKGFNGKYWVSDEGEVRSIDRLVEQENRFGSYKRLIKGQKLQPKKQNRGYLMVGLSQEGKVKSCLVHQLVAQAFIPNPDNLPEINHISEDKTDNRVENLEFCDRKYNINYGTHTQRVTQKLINGKTSKSIIQFDLNGNFVAEYPSLMEAERQTGCFESSICACCKGKRKTSSGYKWEYKERAA